jgi:hypothetical protein
MKKMKKMSAEQRNAQHGVQDNAKKGFISIGTGNEGSTQNFSASHHKEQHGAKRGQGAYPKQEKPWANKHKEAAPNAQYDFAINATGEHKNKKWNKK